MINPELLKQLDIQTRETTAGMQNPNQFNEFEWMKACDRAVEIARKHPENVMEVLESETDDRFIAMANHLDELDFLSDEKLVHIIRLAQKRKRAEVFDEVKRNLGCQFDRLYKLSCKQ